MCLRNNNYMEFLVETKNGKLNIDRVLFESNIPIIFTCVNEVDELFITVCCRCNREGYKWLAGKIMAEDVIAYLEDKISLRTLLTDISKEHMSIDYIQGGYVVEYSNSDWDDGSIYLPNPDSFIEADEGEFDEDIEYYRDSIKRRVLYNPMHYQIIQNGLSNDISIDMNVLTDRLQSLISAIQEESVSENVNDALREVLSSYLTTDLLKVNNKRFKKKWEFGFEISDLDKFYGESIDISNIFQYIVAA